MLKEIVKYLKESEVQYLASIGLDGNPKVRPFQLMFEDGGKLWYCTGEKKEVYKELVAHPYVEFCAMAGSGMNWMRMSAKVVFVDDMDIKEKIISTNALVRSIYVSAGNPELKILYLDEISAVIAGIGKLPHVVKV